VLNEKLINHAIFSVIRYFIPICRAHKLHDFMRMFSQASIKKNIHILSCACSKIWK